MTRKKNSETITENIFRTFYGAHLLKNLLSRLLMALLQREEQTMQGILIFSDLKKIIVLLWRLKQPTI
ncbi:MAG: hypothetical protein ACLSB9_09980 [Hydrogeniiclostridium mannosilyticum]